MTNLLCPCMCDDLSSYISCILIFLIFVDDNILVGLNPDIGASLDVTIDRSLSKQTVFSLSHLKYDN